MHSINYYSDLSPLSQAGSTDISFTQPGLGIFYTFWFGRRYSVKAEFMIATLHGSDLADRNDLNKSIYCYRRNLSFRNQIKEFSITGVLDSEWAKALSYRTNEFMTPDNPFTYLARDGKTYTVENGYGSEGNIRGKEQPDLYMTTTRFVFCISLDRYIEQNLCDVF